MNAIVVGKLQLKTKVEFTQYSEHAAWTDYVTCEPQEVDLKCDGYWVFASFDGVLTNSTFPKDAREVGSPARACVQTQMFGGIGNWLDSESRKVTITNPAFHVSQVSKYSDGRPMFALQRQ